MRRVPPDACTLSGELDTPDQPLLLAQLSPLHAALSESQKKGHNCCYFLTMRGLYSVQPCAFPNAFPSRLERLACSVISLWHTAQKTKICKGTDSNFIYALFFKYDCLTVKLGPGGNFLCAITPCVHFILMRKSGFLSQRKDLM